MVQALLQKAGDAREAFSVAVSEGDRVKVEDYSQWTRVYYIQQIKLSNEEGNAMALERKMSTVDIAYSNLCDDALEGQIYYRGENKKNTTELSHVIFTNVGTPLLTWKTEQ